MKPRGAMWIQAVALVVAVAIVALTPSYEIALVLSAVLGLWWALFGGAFLASTRHVDLARSRRVSDAHVYAQVILAVVAASVSHLALGLAVGVAFRREEAVCVMFGLLAVVALVVFMSSLIDWYYVRPRLDGVVRQPPCLSSRDPAWGHFTRMWYLHRAVAELLVLLALIGAATALGIATLAHSLAPAAIASGSAASLFVLIRSAIGTLRNQAVNAPGLWVGDLLRDRDGHESYLLQVHASGVLVRALDPDNGRWSEPSSISHRQLEEMQPVVARFAGCDSCPSMNPECEWLRTRWRPACGGTVLRTLPDQRHEFSGAA